MERNSKIICALVVALLVARAPAHADGVITVAKGSVHITSQVRAAGNSGVFLFNCEDSGTFSVPGFEDAQTPSVNLPCDSFSNTCTDVDGSKTTSVSGSATGSASGDPNHVSLHVAANGNASTTGTGNCVPGIPLAESSTSGTISFKITDQPTAVAISVAVGTPVNTEVSVTLRRTSDSTNLGQISADKNGTTGSISSATLSPGDYSLEWNAITPTISATQSNGPYGFDITVDVSVAGGAANEVRWINPAGGAFGTDTNWNPQRVPVIDGSHSDTAVFDLTIESPVVITATNNAVARLVDRRMNVALLGSARTAGSASDFSFEVDDGGIFALTSGAQFTSANTGIGTNIGTESSVFVSGPNTKWSSIFGLTSVQTGNRILIGGGAPGKLVVDQGGTLASNNDLSVGAQAVGTLRVESGGQVQAPNCSLLNGSIQVRGRSSSAASKLKIDSQLDLGGENGSGNMLVETGGQVDANGLFVGDKTGNGGETLTITGLDDAGNPSSLHVAAGGLIVARDAATQIEVKDGGELSTSGSARIGNAQSVGTLLVHGKSAGASATWGHTGDAFVGAQSTAASQLIVNDGGRVTITNQMVFGRNAGELGSASVSGNDSQVVCGSLFVGVDGRGSLRISDGASVVCSLAEIGVSSQVPAGDAALLPTTASGGGGVGTVIIESGPRSKLQVNGNCIVGFDELGNVLLDGGGTTLEVVGTLLIQTHGIISGNGLLAAVNVVNNGIMSPHLSVVDPSTLKIRLAAQDSLTSTPSPGVLSVEGNYEQTADGILNVVIAGLGDGQFDVLNISGDAALGGTLEVHFVDGFLPKTGDSVDFLQVTGNVTGEFSQVTFPELAPGFQSDLTFVDGKLRLTARSDAVAANPTVPSALNCGAGTCGAGSAAMLPLTMLALLRRKQGRVDPLESLDGAILRRDNFPECE